MAVGALRTVLVAHMQSTTNRMIREMGRNRALATSITLLVFSFVGIVPLCLGLGFIGYALMELIEDPTSVAILASLFTVFPLFGGMTSGLVAGARELAWERYRTYPVRVRTLFVAELIAAMGDLIPVLVGLASASVLIGMAVVDARILVVAPLVWLEAVVTVLVVQMLIGGIAESAMRVMRRAAGVGFALVLVAALFAARALRHAHQARPTDFAARFQDATRRIATIIDWLPTGVSIRSLLEAAHGNVARALVLHVYPLAVLGACAVAAAYLMAREANGTHVVSERSERVRLWSFTKPWVGIARAHAAALMRSPLGRFGLLMPVISIALIKGPLSESLGTSRLQTLSTFSYVAVSTVQLHFGAFGMDGHGIKALLLLPIRPRDLLFGKMITVLAYHVIQLLILAVFLYLLGSTTLLELASGFLLALAIFFTQAAIGHRVSLWMPRAFPKRGMRRTAMPLPLTLLSIGTFLFALGLYGGAYYVGAAFGQAALFGAMFVALLVSLGVYAVMSVGLPSFFEKHREKLLHALSE